MTPFRAFATGAAALLGAAGVAAAAGSSHAGAGLLAPLALIALTHAPAVLALALAAPHTRAFALATILLAAGALLFCADLGARQFWGGGLFPLSAPLGGMLMIAGWLATGLAGILALERPSGKKEASGR